ncbi:MAG: hypothetical protein ABIP39_12745 [Polyangiaceae bacterium]
MKTRTIRSRFNRRQNSAGVAMVEAAAVLPVLLMFFGLFRFVGSEYDAKLQTSWDARNQAWDDAVHGCKGSANANNGVRMANADPNNAASQINRGPRDPVKDRTSAMITNGPSRGSRSNFGLVSQSNKSVKALVKAPHFTREIVSTSSVFCNEQNYEEDSAFKLVALAKFVISAIPH